MSRHSNEADGTEAAVCLLPMRKGTKVPPYAAQLNATPTRPRLRRQSGQAPIRFAMPLPRGFTGRRARSAVHKALGHSDLSTTMVSSHVVDEKLEGDHKGVVGRILLIRAKRH